MRAVHCSSYSSVRMTKIFAPARWRIAGSVLSAPQCFYSYCPRGVRKDRDGRRIQAEANQRRLADSSKETAPSLCWSRVLSAHTHAHEVAENKCHDNPRKNIRTWHHASFAHQAPPAVHSFTVSRLAAKNVRQLSDVAGDTTRLGTGTAGPATVLSDAMAVLWFIHADAMYGDVSERLAVGVLHFIAARNLLDRPRRGKRRCPSSSSALSDINPFNKVNAVTRRPCYPSRSVFRASGSSPG